MRVLLGQVSFDPGDLIITEGDDGHRMYILAAGRAGEASVLEPLLGNLAP